MLCRASHSSSDRSLGVSRSRRGSSASSDMQRKAPGAFVREVVVQDLRVIEGQRRRQVVRGEHLWLRRVVAGTRDTGRCADEYYGNRMMTGVAARVGVHTEQVRE